MQFVLTGCLLLLALSPASLRGEETPAAIMAHTRSVYAALTSYTDTGTLVSQYGPSGRDERSFSTYFNRTPRHFLLDYHRAAGDRIVIWGDPDGFHTWWKSVAQVMEYPNPKNTGAFSLTDFPTGSVSTKIAPLLYSKAGMPGTIAQFEPERLAGMENVGDNKCFRLEGSASDTYGSTGKKVNTRKVILWIDATSYLVRKVLEDAPAPPGSLNRTTITFDPHANPKIDDASFQFAPPK